MLDSVLQALTVTDGDVVDELVMLPDPLFELLPDDETDVVKVGEIDDDEEIEPNVVGVVESVPVGEYDTEPELQGEPVTELEAVPE